MVKELQPIVLGVAVWGSSWQGYTVQCLCDNAAVVAISEFGSEQDGPGDAPHAVLVFLPGTLECDIAVQTSSSIVEWSS